MTDKPQDFDNQEGEEQTSSVNEEHSTEQVQEEPLAEDADVKAQVEADLAALKEQQEELSETVDDTDATIEEVEDVATTIEAEAEDILDTVEEEAIVATEAIAEEVEPIIEATKEEIPAPIVEEVAMPYVAPREDKATVVEFDVPQKEEKAPRKSSGFFGGIKNIILDVWTWKNVGIWAIFLVVSFWILTTSLGMYTRHGESTVVADFKGKDVLDAKTQAEAAGFILVVSDSIYDVSIPEGIIFEQFPAPESAVKEGRTIYVKCGGKPAKLRLPTFEGNYNYTNYTKRLSYAPYNMRTGMVKEKKFDAILEENTILTIYHEGKEITEKDLKRGVEVTQGDSLSFVVSTRISDYVPIPNLVCKTYSEANFLLTSNSLSVGTVEGEVDNKNSAYVWKQFPSYKPGKTITRGTPVELYLQATPPDDCE